MSFFKKCSIRTKSTMVTHMRCLHICIMITHMYNDHTYMCDAYIQSKAKVISALRLNTIYTI